MNDLENQLQSLQFSQPDPEWKKEILAECHAQDAGARTRWQDWLWPSPLAWAAMVIIWLGCGIATQIGRPAKKVFASSADFSSNSPLVAMQSPQEIDALFQLSPKPRQL